MVEKDFYEKPLQDLTPEEMRQLRKDLAEEFQEIRDGMTEEEAKEVKRITSALTEDLNKIITPAFREGVEAALQALTEYAEENRQTSNDLFTDKKINEVLAAIRERSRQLLEIRATKKPGEKTARPIRTDKIDFPLDKINNRVWNLLERETTGQIVFDLAGAPKKKTPAIAPAFYSINFDELDQDEDLKDIVRQLTPTDKRIYLAIAALYAAGNKSMSYTQIYYLTGKKGKPGWHDRENIEKSILKMMRAIVTINDQEAAAVKGWEAYPIKTHLLPAAITPLTEESRNLKGEERGRVAPLIEPPLLTYARRHKQITTLPLKLLQAPINKTDSVIATEDYLLDAIAHAKRLHEETIVRLYDTIASRTRQISKKQRARLPEKVHRLLDYYVECKHIKKYEKRPDGVEITL